MSITIELEKMSIEEKMQTMEMIWDDLCHGSGKIKSPDWHKEVLADREQALIDKTDEFIDWETAKKNINKAVR